MQIAIVSSGLFDIQFHIIDLHRFVLLGGIFFVLIQANPQSLKSAGYIPVYW
jgi:hypothetical protein